MVSKSGILSFKHVLIITIILLIAVIVTCNLNLNLLSASLFQNGQTPLMVAAEQGHLEILQELIRRGANVNLDDVVSTHTHTDMCTPL